MARGSGVIVRGTAREIAEHGTGYSANGEGEYSRRVASAPNVKMRGHVAKTRGKHSQVALIAENESLLARLRGEIAIETDPARLAKLKKNFEIKTRFVERLRSEARD